MITLTHYLILSAIVFGLGIAGMMINRKNLIIVLMCIELILLAVNTNFVAISFFHHNIFGQLFVFFILTVAAAEAAIGLAILMVLYRDRRTINIGEQSALKG